MSINTRNFVKLKIATIFIVQISENIKMNLKNMDEREQNEKNINFFLIIP